MPTSSLRCVDEASRNSPIHPARRQGAPGFARCRIRPQPGDLPDLELTVWSVKGPIEFRARREGTKHRVEVSAPKGCEAVLGTQVIAGGTSGSITV